MKKFDFFEPTSLKEATELLTRWGEKSKILAGGTDLLVEMKEGEVAPEALIALRMIPGLSYIRREDDSVKVGAFTSHRALEKSSEVRSLFPALADAVDTLGSIQVRNIATVGGNICNGAPSADTVPPLLVHDARLTVYGPKGERVLPLNGFFEGPWKTKLGTTEILKEIIVPLPTAITSSVYIKLTRRSCMELPLIGVASRVTFDPEGKVLEGRIALACAGPMCFRATAAEALFPGRKIEERFLKDLGEAVLGESRPRDSFRCSAQYRREMIPVLVARSVRQCYERSFKEGRRFG
jgi:CO/xanthine dehydrogenase FAD-binding subunit